jgi:oxygen-independent coproporphyrinogen-3 oxidase
VREIEAWGRDTGGPRLDTVFIGGGTPSRVPAAHIGAALEAVRASFDLAPDAEVTIEANPQSAEAERMEAWLEAGVNRLSLGLQSLDDGALRFLERAHDAEEARGVFARARRAGFENVSCDLIFAVPGLSLERWREVLTEVLALGPEHVSAYELTPEPGTRLGADVAAGRTLLPEEGEQAEQYAAAEELLAAAGMRRYEVSNWSRPGRECRHNLAYWRGVPYAAAGAGAHAYLHLRGAREGLASPGQPGAFGVGEVPPVAAIALRRWNLASPAAHIAAVEAGRAPVAGHEWSDLPTALAELMMMGLRKEPGVDLAEAGELFGVDLEIVFGEELAALRRDGLVEPRGQGAIRPTARGRRVLNGLAATFLPDAQRTPVR